MFKIIIIFTGFLIFYYINRDKALKYFKEHIFKNENQL